MPVDDDALPQRPPHPTDRVTFFAFAQLAAFKLRAKRAFVSLVEPESQYILAEATADIPPAHDAVTAEEQLLLGITTVPLKDAFLDHKLLEDPSPRHAETRKEGCDHFVSLDCTRDDRFRDHALVQRDGGVRFLAGVSLASPATGTITLVVADDSPRDSMKNDDIEALHEYAKCIIKHMELVRETIYPSREVSVLRGIIGSMSNQYQPDATSYDADSPTQQEDETPAKEADLNSLDYQSRPRSMEAWLTSAFDGAAKVFRQCSSADGAAIFGLHDISTLVQTDGSSTTRGEEGLDTGISRSSLLAYSGVECAAAVDQRTPSPRTLRRFASACPRGMAFDVTGKICRERAGFRTSSKHSYTAVAMNKDSIVDEEEGDELGKLHEEVLASLAEAQSLVFLPVYDQDDGALLACCFLWDESGIRMASSSKDVREYRALGNFLSHNVAQVRMQTKDAEQDRFGKFQNGFLSGM